MSAVDEELLSTLTPEEREAFEASEYDDQEIETIKKIAGEASDDDDADDEQPPKAKPEKIPSLKPAFRDGGTVTAATNRASGAIHPVRDCVPATSRYTTLTRRAATS